MPGKRAPASAGRMHLQAEALLFFKLVRVVNLTARPFVETLSRKHHLSLNEWRAMVVLASHPGVAAREIAEHTGLDKMSVSRAIAALFRHDRIRKEADLGDARRTRLWLTDSGTDLFEAIGSSASVRGAQLFAGISRGEQQQLGQTIDRLLAALQTSETE